MLSLLNYPSSILLYDLKFEEMRTMNLAKDCRVLCCWVQLAVPALQEASFFDKQESVESFFSANVKFQVFIHAVHSMS